METEIAQLPSRDIDAMACTTRFLERLLHLPLTVWRDVALEAFGDASEADVLALAHAIRESVDPVDAWSVRDDVETVMYRFEHCRELAGWSTPTIAAVRAATEHAALSILVRSVLVPAAYDALSSRLLALAWSSSQPASVVIPRPSPASP